MAYKSTYQPTVNTPSPIKKRDYGYIAPPVSWLKYRDVPNNSGVEYKRFPSLYWGNSLYKTSNEWVFDNYYDANTVQSLLNSGICEDEILKHIPAQPIYNVPETNKDVLGFEKGRHSIYYAPVRLLNYPYREGVDYQPTYPS